MAKKYESIIFDLDGTLFQTDKLVIPAFQKTFEQLKMEGYEISYMPDERELLSVIGLTLDDVWQNLLPDVSKENYIKANNFLLENELSGVRAGYGALYPNVTDTLIELKNRGYRLFIASNGLKEYVYGITEEFRIDHYFDAIYSAGEFNTATKKELVHKLVTEFEIKDGIMVGDRSSDVEAGKNNNLFVVGCSFGFSTEKELESADKIIESIEQIFDVIT